jgi:hypothetical protein
VGGPPWVGGGRFYRVEASWREGGEEWARKAVSGCGEWVAYWDVRIVLIPYSVSESVLRIRYLQSVLSCLPKRMNI